MRNYFSVLWFRTWKFEYMATDLLALQLREDHPLPPDAVLFFTQGLIHDSICVRKVCSCVCAVCLYGDGPTKSFSFVVQSHLSSQEIGILYHFKQQRNAGCEQL